ncbi:MAG: formylglycine-generating enzyme family protein [Anaerolineae bacterium]
MKRLIPILVALSVLVTACQMGGGQAQPTPLALPTAFPTNTPAVNPTQSSGGGKVEAGSERTSPVDGMVQVYIPAGTFQMGGIDSKASQDEKPVHPVTMHGFWIDKVEVTNAMYMLCVKAGACRLPHETKSQTRQSYFNNPEYNDYPVVYVGWGDAKAYCEWANRRLPTEAEWERAARGDDFRTYPWGDERPDSSRANFNFYVGDTTRVGSFPAGASPFGVLDMAGNVAEWVNDFYDAGYYSSAINVNPPGPLARANYFNRVVRGGTFQDGEIDIRLANRASVLGPNPDAPLDSPQYYGEFSPKIGFRCAADE